MAGPEVLAPARDEFHGDRQPGSCHGLIMAEIPMTRSRTFWWGDWTKMIGNAITAVRTGEPVLYPDDDEPE